MIKRYLKKIRAVNAPGDLDKHQSETKFWQDELDRYNQWYNGSLQEMYATKAPTEDEKVKSRSPTHAAILTWHKLHQEIKYLRDLNLDREAFKGKKILDIGSGPMPSATCFK